jgi:hypothetical protein
MITQAKAEKKATANGKVHKVSAKAELDAEGVKGKDMPTIPSIQEVVKSIFDNGDNLGYTTMEEHPDTRVLQKAFLQEVDAFSTFYHCPKCRHKFFDVKESKKNPGQCTHCDADQKKGNVLTLTAANTMDPFIGGYPWHLPTLTQIEEILIARIHPVMQCYRLGRGAHVGFRGNIINLEYKNQAFLEKCASLPLIPTQVPILIMRRPDKHNPSGYREFRVRREAIMRWLVHLREHSVYYKDIIISEENLRMYPVEGCSADLFATMTEEEATEREQSDKAECTASQESSAPPQGSESEASQPQAGALDAGTHDVDTKETRQQANSPGQDGNRSDGCSTETRQQPDNPGQERTSNTGGSANVASSSLFQASQGDESDDEDGAGPEVFDQQGAGPHQAGASGRNQEEEAVDELYIPLAIKENEIQEDAIKKILLETFGNVNHVEMPEFGAKVNEYTTPGIQAMAFPTLFPYGKHGDCTFGDRFEKVSYTLANKHLLQVCSVDSTGLDRWLFAEHARWCFHAFNTCERHRTQKLQEVFLHQNPGDANLTAEALTDIIDNKPEELNAMLGRMNKYNGNINGGNAYLHRNKRNLDALVDQQGAPTAWYSFSMAENYWPDGLRVLDDKTHSRTFPNADAKGAQQRKLCRNNPHIVSEFFFRRFDALFKTFFGPNGMECDWHYCRKELQNRGVFHVHGCFRLVADSGLTGLGKRIVNGRLAQRICEKHGIQLDESFSKQEQEQDEWANDISNSDSNELNEVEVAKLQEDVKLGLRAHRIVCTFQDFLLTVWHPEPPTDCNEVYRHESTEFKPSNAMPHPSCNDLRDWLYEEKVQCDADADSDATKDYYCRMLDAVERHVHQSYCQKGKCKQRRKRGDPPLSEKDKAICKNAACWFAYPMPIRESTMVAIKQWTGKDKMIHSSIEILPRRNDAWVNSHNRSIMEVHAANFDLRLTIDIGKIMGYMNKYINKSESCTTPGAMRMMKRLMKANLEQGSDSTRVLKQTMGRTMGERTIPKQEAVALMLGSSIVVCSHAFSNVYLCNDSRKLDLDCVDDEIKTPAAAAVNSAPAPSTAVAAVASASATSTGTSSTDDATVPTENKNETHLSDGKRVIIMTLVDAYAVRMSDRVWSGEDLFVTHQDDLEKMTLCQFCALFFVGRSGQFKNQIRLHTRKEFCAVFFPRMPCDPSKDTYPDYCKYSLIKYKPWQDLSVEVWGGDDAAKEDIIALWEDHVRAMKENDTLPECLEIDLARLESSDPNRRNDELAAIAYADAMDNVDDTQEKEEFCNVYSYSEAQQQEGEPNAVTWDCNVDYKAEEPSMEGDQKPVDDVRKFWEKTCKTHKAEIVEDPNKKKFELTTKQLLAQDMCTMLVNGVKLDVNGGKCGVIYGLGGTGKTATIEEIILVLASQHGPNTTKVLATTGRAASLLPGGCTAHNVTDGLALPTSSGAKQAAYSKLSKKSLSSLQKMWKGVKLCILDEFSMLRQSELYWCSLRLQEIFGNDLVFGGIAFVLSGDPGQIPAVMGKCVWDLSHLKSEANNCGEMLWTGFFKNVIELDKVLRQNNPDYIAFLKRLHDGLHTVADWELICKMCSRDSMGEVEWKKRFVDEDATHLFCRNADVREHNLGELSKLDKPIYLVEAKNTGNAAKMDADRFRGLDSWTFLAYGAQVLLTMNKCPLAGVCNGMVGTVVAIIYADGTSPPALPEVVWIEAKEYTGPSLFPNDPTRRHWIPIFPVDANDFAHKDGEILTNTRSMIPLRLSWAWTIWKSQGQTYKTKPVVLHLGDKEPEHGITYTAFSRVEKMEMLGIEGGLTRKRFIDSVKNHQKMGPRIAAEKRLKTFESTTIERIHANKATESTAPHESVEAVAPSVTAMLA